MTVHADLDLIVHIVQSQSFRLESDIVKSTAAAARCNSTTYLTSCPGCMVNYVVQYKGYPSCLEAALVEYGRYPVWAQV